MSRAPITTLLLTALAWQLAPLAPVYPAASRVPPEAGRLLACQADVGRAARQSDAARTCPLPGSAPPTLADLLGCGLGQVQCVAQRSVALTVPRAYEFLSDLDLDPDALYPCVPDLGDG